MEYPTHNYPETTAAPRAGHLTEQYPAPPAPQRVSGNSAAWSGSWVCSGGLAVTLASTTARCCVTTTAAVGDGPGLGAV